MNTDWCREDDIKDYICSCCRSLLDTSDCPLYLYTKIPSKDSQFIALCGVCYIVRVLYKYSHCRHRTMVQQIFEKIDTLSE